MSSVKKHTPQKRTARRAVATQKKDPFKVALGERLKAATEAMGWSQTRLAAQLARARGRPTPQTRLVGEYFAGTVAPDAQSISLFCQMLDVSADWLLVGAGPMRSSQGREVPALERDIAAAVRRAVWQRLVEEDDGRWAGIAIDDLAVNGAQVLDQAIDQGIANFRGTVDMLLDTRAKELAVAQQERTIDLLHGALSAKVRSAIAPHLFALTLNAGVVVMEDHDQQGTVQLSQTAIDSLARRWQMENVTEAEEQLQRALLDEPM